MARLLIVTAVVLAALTSCQERSQNTGGTDGDSLVSARPEPVAPSTDTAAVDSLSPARFPMWFVDAEKKIKRRNPEFREEFLGTAYVIRNLNRKYPRVQVSQTGQQGDTLLLAIPESAYLTQQMGSAGTEAWFADAVINLTAVPGVSAVRFDFEEGDHAAPGVRTEKSYSGYREE